MTRKLRIAAVGAGYFSQFQYDAWARIQEVEVVAICNRHPDRAGAIAEKYAIDSIYDNIHTMLDTEKPDLLGIITPPQTHSEYCRAAIDRAIVAICQKPFTGSLNEAEDLVKYAQENQGMVVIHENFRFQPWYSKIKALLDTGRLGDLYEIQFRLRPGDGMGPDAYHERQPYFRNMQRFLVHETAVHLIDVFRYLFGEITSVYADLTRFNPAIAGEDAGVILFDFANGARGIFNGNRGSDHVAKNRHLTMGELCIEGTGGTLKLNGDGNISFRLHGSNDEEAIGYDWADNDFGGDCVYRTQRHIIDALTSGTPAMNSASDYLTNLKIVELVYDSFKTGKKIRCI